MTVKITAGAAGYAGLTLAGYVTKDVCPSGVSHFIVTLLDDVSVKKIFAVTIPDAGVDSFSREAVVAQDVDAADTYLGTRSLNIVCGVFGTSTGDLGDKVQAVLDAMRPIPRTYEADYGFRQLAFSQATIDVSNFSVIVCVINAWLR